VTGFLAVDDVIAGFYAHEELDAVLGAFEVVGSGFPDQLAIVCYAKDVEGRDHGGGYITAVTRGCTGLNKADGSWSREERGNASKIPALRGSLRKLRGGGDPHRTRAMMRQPELLPRTTAWYSGFGSRMSNLG